MYSDAHGEIKVLPISDARQPKQICAEIAGAGAAKNEKVSIEETFKCKKCGKVFRGKEELKVHKRLNHRANNEQNRETVYLWQNISGW